jgi:hypothetical protein
MNGECAMKAALAFRKALLFGLLMLLLLFPIKTKAGSPIGSSIVVSAGSEQEVSPTIAYNSQRQEYLVVWYNDRPGCDDIRAQRVASNGKLAGSPFYISAGCPADRRYPDVTYNSKHDQYLVVWEHYDSSSASINSLHGRRVLGDGQLLDKTDITIRNSGAFYAPGIPAVAYASYSDRYLVVWGEDGDIYGQVLTDTGGLEGNIISISTGPAFRQYPDLAYNRHANRFLVVWEEIGATPYDIYGQQVQGDGKLYQSNISIANLINHCENPAIAALPTSPGDIKFVVVYEYEFDMFDYDIHQHFIDEEGALQVSSGANSPDDDFYPAVAASETNQQYFVVWRREFQGSGDSSILGQAISYNGDYIGGVSEFLGEDVDFPAVAAGPAGDFLVVWQDQPVGATDTNIYGQLWGNRIYLPATIH